MIRVLGDGSTANRSDKIVAGGLTAAGGSVGLHGAILLSLMAAAYFRVEALDAPEARRAPAPVPLHIVAPAAAAPPPPSRRSGIRPDRETVIRPARPQITEPIQPEAPAGVADPAPLEEGSGAGIEGGLEGGEDGGRPGGIVGGDPEGAPWGAPGGDPDGQPGGIPGSGTGEGEPRILTGDVRPPERTHFVKPEYPEIARKARHEGKVILEVVIGRAGDVEEVKVLKSDPLLDLAAVEAVRRWKYQPAMQDGRPVKVYLTVVVRFELS